jgi:hypothetical protein
MKRQQLMAVAITSLLVVAGCSDNSDSGGAQQPMPADPLASVPDSAQASAAGLVAYLEVLADNKVEDRMPVALEGVMLMQRDDTEPIGLQ